MTDVPLLGCNFQGTVGGGEHSAPPMGSLDVEVLTSKAVSAIPPRPYAVPWGFVFQVLGSFSSVGVLSFCNWKFWEHGAMFTQENKQRLLRAGCLPQVRHTLLPRGFRFGLCKHFDQ